MNQEQVWQEFLMLPPEAQKEIAELITTLHTRYKAPSLSPGGSRPSIKSEPFFGMWRDREDVTDSSEWVRGVRRKEWGDDSLDRD